MSEKPEEMTDTSENSSTPLQPETPDKSETSEKTEISENSEQPDIVIKTEKTEQTEKTEKPEKPETSDKSSKPEAKAKSANPGPSGKPPNQAVKNNRPPAGGRNTRPAKSGKNSRPQNSGKNSRPSTSGKKTKTENSETPPEVKEQKNGGVRSIGDFFKRKKGDKKFFLKVGIGIGVVLLLLIIIIVVAAVASKGGDDGGTESVNTATSGVTGFNQEVTTTTTTPKPIVNLEFTIPSYHLIQLGNVKSMLALDDVTKSYVIQMDEEFRSIYYLVKFKERTQTYVGIQKTSNLARSRILENTVLFCYSRGLDSDFTGNYVSAAAMEASGRTHSTVINGRNISIVSSQISTPLELDGPLAKIFNMSCDSLDQNDKFEWREPETACDGNQTAALDYGTCQQMGRCPDMNTVKPLSTTKACKTFKQCNYVMGSCDRFWTNRNPYNNMPYCHCRDKLYDETFEHMCPDPIIDDAECEAPRRRATDRSKNSPCWCHYSIRRIFPYAGRNGAMSWLANSITVTGPAPKAGHCSCN